MSYEEILENMPQEMKDDVAIDTSFIETETKRMFLDAWERAGDHLLLHGDGKARPPEEPREEEFFFCSCGEPVKKKNTACFDCQCTANDDRDD
jgi:hypothetical protein